MHRKFISKYKHNPADDEEDPILEDSLEEYDDLDGKEEIPDLIEPNEDSNHPPDDIREDMPDLYDSEGEDPILEALQKMKRTPGNFNYPIRRGYI